MKRGIILFFLIAHAITAQTIKGSFPQATNTEIILSGFDGFASKELAKTTTDSKGSFLLSYPKNYTGAALVQIKNNTSVIVILHQENFEMQWDNLKDFSTLKMTNSPENDAFGTSIAVNQEAENKLSALRFLLPRYEKMPNQQKWLQEEIAVQEKQFENYLDQLPKDSYAKEYVNIRKLIKDFPQTANRNIERMPQNELEFNALNFNDEKLRSSGLLKELLDSYFLLMESHGEQKKVYASINASTDAIVKSLAANPTLQQEVAQYLFNYFEKKSLSPAAEHLALQMLNQSNCQLSEKSTNLFEQYRKLAVGKTAPNIIYESKESRGKNKNVKSLANAYKLIVFGASWCPNCQTDYPKLKEKYGPLKQKYDLEMVYISIDTDKAAFEKQYKDAPFIVFCDTKGWETQAAKDYHVFATPTAILLDKDMKIMAKLNSPDHLQAWLEARGVVK